MAEVLPRQVGDGFQSGAAPLLEEQDVVGELEGVVGLVGAEQHRQALAVHEPAEPPQHPDLVAGVEGGGGLVQYKQPPALAEGAGDQHQLPLAAAEFLDPAFPEPRHPDRFECLIGRLPVGLPGAGPQTPTGHLAQHHGLSSGEVEGHLAGLRDVADHPGQGRRTVALQPTPADLDLARVCAQQPQQDPEQG